MGRKTEKAEETEAEPEKEEENGPSEALSDRQKRKAARREKKRRNKEKAALEQTNASEAEGTFEENIEQGEVSADE